MQPVRPTTIYGVNGLGERVAKDGPPSSGKVEFVFDLSGGLLGQYSASGAPAEEIVWLGALPVGTIQGGAAYTIAPDHLGAPHQIVNSANVSVWFWDHEPFGDGWPASALGFTHRLRFPGQIYDAESNLHSNGHRDYDPRLGRYVESDPIGLAGGINTYAYAGNDPVNAIDPFGTSTNRVANSANATLPAISIMARPAAGAIVEGLGIGGAVTTGALLLPLGLSGDTRMDEGSRQFIYVTYTRTNLGSGQVYSGRTSGYANPSNPVELQAIATARGYSQPLLNAEGFLPPMLDQATDSYSAIRGREQQLIDFYGGAQSAGGTARNMINGISDLNPLRPIYMNSATSLFGPLPSNRP
jgi:RHS repeat-associated protein